MRVMISGSCLMVVLAIIVLIHSTMIGDNIREQEVEQSLNTAMDYSYDKMLETYEDKEFTSKTAEERNDIMNSLMQTFCENLQQRISSDGEVTIYLMDSDLETGLFQIGIMENYKYPFGGRRGSCYYEKTYYLV